MTTDPHEEHGDVLRRALRGEADSVVPAPDGLERIRARIDERSQRRFAWNWLAAGWQRPALALGAAAFLLALGVSAPQTFDRITSAGDKGPADRGRPPSAAGPSPGADSQPTGPQQQTDTGKPGGPTTDGKIPSAPAAAPGVPTCQPAGGDNASVKAPSTPGATDSGNVETKKLPPCPPSGAKPTPKPTDPAPSEPNPSPSAEPTTSTPQQPGDQGNP